jgi:LuxR family maltose regulon positive regulatory protein
MTRTPASGAIALRTAGGPASARPVTGALDRAIEACIDRALGVGDVDAAGRLVAEHGLRICAAGRVAVVERWLVAFEDPPLYARYPEVALLGAWAHAVHGRAETASRWARSATPPAREGGSAGGSAPVPQAALLRAALCERGVDAMREDAALAVGALPGSSPWLPTALLVHAAALAMGGDRETSAAATADAARHAALLGMAETAVLALSAAASTALEDARPADAQAFITEAGEWLAAAKIERYPTTTTLLAVRARSAVEEGDASAATRDLRLAEQLRPRLTHALPWLAVHTRLGLAQAHLGLGEVPDARTLLVEIDDILRRRPDMGTLRAAVDALRHRLSALVDARLSGWPSTLTAAELRLLPVLATHLSFREIGERLFISRNTVKTEAISIYRKLGVASRTGALERARQLGLVDLAPVASGPPASRRTTTNEHVSPASVTRTW